MEKLKQQTRSPSTVCAVLAKGNTEIASVKPLNNRVAKPFVTKHLAVDQNIHVDFWQRLGLYLFF